MKKLSMVSPFILILCITIACTSIQSQNPVQPAPLGYIPIPTKDEILTNAQFGIEQPEIIYARLLLSQEATEAAGVGVVYGDFYKPDDPVWVVAVKSGTKRIQFPGFGDIEGAGVLHIIKAATGDAISTSSIQDIANDAGLLRLQDLPDRAGTIEIQPEPVPTTFIPPPTPTAISITSRVLEAPNQDVFTSLLPTPTPIQLSPLPAPDILDAALRRHAGANSINCGVVQIAGATAAANQCVDKAYQAKQAFIVIYHLQGIDSFVAEGLAGNRQGEIRAYSYDSDPAGGGKPIGNPYEVVHERECQTLIPVLWGTNELRRCE